MADIRWLFVSLFATIALAASDTNGLNSMGFTSLYTRSGPAATLSETHERLLAKDKHENLPEQVHLALGGAGEMTVSWVTPDPVKETSTKVSFWLKAQKSDLSDDDIVRINDKKKDVQVAIGSNATYSCGAFYILCPAGYKSGVVHHAVLKGLRPDTTYSYRIGDEKSSKQVKYSFKTAPVPGPNVRFTYSIVADLGQTSNSLTTIEHMEASSAGLVMHIGDLSYADGYQPRWDTYGRLIEPLASRVPWMTNSGNHEVELELGPNSKDRQFLAYNTRYHMPPLTDPALPPKELISEGSNNNFYSFTHGSVRWIMLGSYVDFTATSTQYAWLKAELAKIDRSETPWLFVGAHAPWYNTNSAHSMEYEGDGMRLAMEHLVYAAAADLLFFGHVHSYERTFPVNQMKRDDCGPTYIVIGDGGNREGIAGPFLEPQPHWSAFREGSYGHGTVEVFNSTHAVWKWRRNQDGVAEVADELWLDKTRRPKSCGADASKNPSSRLGLATSNESPISRSVY